MAVSLVTGGAGFIGSHLVGALLASGDRVRVIDNFSTGKAENLAGFNGRLEVREGDIRDPGVAREACQGVDQIFHQAAFISVPLSLEKPQECFEINVAGTLQMIDAARSVGIPRMVIASSAAVYGDSEHLPVTEDAACQPLSPYAASKQVAEIYAELYSRLYDLCIVGLRYFNVFGPRQSPNSSYAAAIPIFTQRMLQGLAPTVYGDGLQARDFIFVGDVVRANMLAASTPAAAGRVYNVCTGQPITILDLLDALGEVIGHSPDPEFAPPRPGDIYRSFGDPGRAARELGFVAKTTLIDGLALTMESMRA